AALGRRGYEARAPAVVTTCGGASRPFPSSRRQLSAFNVLLLSSSLRASVQAESRSLPKVFWRSGVRSLAGPRGQIGSRPLATPLPERDMCARSPELAMFSFWELLMRSVIGLA